MPLVTHSTGANVPDVNELLPQIDDIPPACAKRRTAPAESRTTCTPTGPTTHSRIARSWSAWGD